MKLRFTLCAVVVLLSLWLSAEWRCRRLRLELANMRSTPTKVVYVPAYRPSQPPAVEPEPTDAEGYNRRGLLRKHHSVESAHAFNTSGAIDDFTKAIELKPDYAEAHKNRGDTLGSIGDRAGALADYTKVIELQPDDAEAYLKRSNLELSRNDAAAIADATKAVELKPDDADAYYSRGVVRVSSHDLDGAIEDYTKSIALKPRFPEYSYKERGYALSLKKDYEGAIADFTKAIDLSPKFAYAYELRGEARKANGDIAGASTDFSKWNDLSGKQ